MIYLKILFFIVFSKIAVLRFKIRGMIFILLKAEKRRDQHFFIKITKRKTVPN